MLIVLYEPEIPPNTGNIARLCAAFGTELHLVEPLGFKLENRYLKRAGLDYWPHVKLRVWPDWNSFLKQFSFGKTDNPEPCGIKDSDNMKIKHPEAEAADGKGGRLILATTKGSQPLQKFRFRPDDALVFGPETRGLPDYILKQSPHRVRIPTKQMDEGGVRSLNLSTAAGIFLYAALTDSGMLDFFS